MAVGIQATSQTIDGKLTSFSQRMRDLMTDIKQLSTQVNGQATGLATLEAMGYSAADAQSALNMISYLNTVAGVYFGSATQATQFNFDNMLSQLWAGQ